jgi:menaquinone-dependent protoporphyrinogen oxidase
MRILITWGSERGGTEGIARMLGEALQNEGQRVDVLPPDQAEKATDFDAVIVGGAVYANRWHRAARRFVARREKDLRRVPVWFFSSGPLDDSAAHEIIPPPKQVEALMERVGALGHATFGGRLLPNAQGFPASAMAKTHSGDWRAPNTIRTWAGEIARALPAARPGIVRAQPGRSVPRLLAYGFAGWALCAATMAALVPLTGLRAALVIHAILAPVYFTLIARWYFRARGAREPLPVAVAFVAIAAALDLAVIASFVQRSLAMFGSFAGTWLPLGLSFFAVWATGALMSTMPWPKAKPPGRQNKGSGPGLHEAPHHSPA